MTNPNRRAAGLRVGRFSRDSGQDFEDWCASHHNAALRLGILTHWVHNEAHAKIIHGQLTWVKPGVSDVTGVLYNNVGGTFAAEMKKRAKRVKRSDIEMEQARHLDAVVRGGGLAFLLARIVDGSVVQEFAAPWQSVPWHVVKSAESVDAADLQPWLIPPDCECYLDPYCPVRGVPVPGVAGGQQRRFPRE